MVLFLFLIIAEILTPVVFRQHFYKLARIKYYIFIVIHVILSMWLWILFFEIISFKSFFDSSQNIWMIMNMAGMICAVLFPRFLLIIMHFTGAFIRRKEGSHIRWLTTTGLVLTMLIFSIIALSTLIGRFNFKTEDVVINVKRLHKDLEGLRIVQISDLHLSGFHHHRHLLKNVMDQINEYEPDIIINTGDFITFGWREFSGFDTILSNAVSKHGNFAVRGNHDAGTYHPDYTEADIENHVLNIDRLIKKSGYTVLNDEFVKVKIGNAKVGMIGVTTAGRHPDILHGNIDRAVTGLDSVDLKILLSHDPNHWNEDVVGRTDIDITFSGHTHGMQMGILTKNFKWSPAKYFYPNWHGLFAEGDQQQYVNRGLGVLAIPFRIWMPPEITVITLKGE